MINTNARSLSPKIISLVHGFEEMNLNIAVITETWFPKGQALEQKAEDLLLGEGLRMAARSREPGAAGFSHGGVAVIWNNTVSLSKHSFPNPEQFEILALTGTIHGCERKIIIIAAYIPPGYAVPRGRACLEKISDLVIELTEKMDGAYLIVTGDFNQWKLGDTLADFPTLWELNAGPTRGDRRIDLIFSNFDQNCTSGKIMRPLETELVEGVQTSSDHNVVWMGAKIDKKPRKKVEKYEYRIFNKEREKKFLQWMDGCKWEEVLSAVGSEKKALAYQATIDGGMDEFFPVRVGRRREGDLPWMNEVAKKKTVRKRRIYQEEGRSQRWY